VAAAYHTLPRWVREAAPPTGGALTHGDWHLGQLVRMPDGWRLIDVDDLGTGDPAWDLARPAAWFAAGVMPPDGWDLLLDAYRAAGGPAVPQRGAAWPALDLPARALTVQTAALAIVNRDLDLAEAFVACCRRIARLEPASAVRVLSKLLRR
jgi:aminoglycoside phosphotransferase (APT) family kinase protein